MRVTTKTLREVNFHPLTRKRIRGKKPAELSRIRAQPPFIARWQGPGVRIKATVRPPGRAFPPALQPNSLGLLPLVLRRLNCRFYRPEANPSRRGGKSKIAHAGALSPRTPQASNRRSLPQFPPPHGQFQRQVPETPATSRAGNLARVRAPGIPQAWYGCRPRLGSEDRGRCPRLAFRSPEQARGCSCRAAGSTGSGAAGVRGAGDYSLQRAAGTRAGARPAPGAGRPGRLGGEPREHEEDRAGRWPPRAEAGPGTVPACRPALPSHRWNRLWSASMLRPAGLRACLVSAGVRARGPQAGGGLRGRRGPADRWTGQRRRGRAGGRDWPEPDGVPRGGRAPQTARPPPATAARPCRPRQGGPAPPGAWTRPAARALPACVLPWLPARHRARGPISARSRSHAFAISRPLGQARVKPGRGGDTEGVVSRRGGEPEAVHA